MNTWGEVVVSAKESHGQEDFMIFLCGLNGDLKNLHASGRCVGGIDISTKVDYERKAFVDTKTITSSYDVKEDIESFAVTAISSFVYMNSGNQYVQLNKTIIINNADFIDTIVPSRYYTGVVKGEVLTYYEDYLNALNNQSNYGNSNGNNLAKSYTYSTAVGRAMTETFREKNLDRAFVNIMFYPVLIASVSILLAVIYVIISILT